MSLQSCFLEWKTKIVRMGSFGKKKLIHFCSEKLEMQITSTQLECVHRFGVLDEGKCRPIIAEFTFFKGKQTVLASVHKVKESAFSIGKHFSLLTREPRKKVSL